eukprot:scaffold13923_cov78-Skeletonema_dohrnii-CCMP3373.AAC.5
MGMWLKGKIERWFPQKLDTSKQAKCKNMVMSPPQSSIGFLDLAATIATTEVEAAAQHLGKQTNVFVSLPTSTFTSPPKQNC